MELSLYIQRELSKIKNISSQVDHTKDFVSERAEAIELDSTSRPVTASELKEAEQGLEQVEHGRDVDIPKLESTFSSLSSFLIKAAAKELNDDYKRSEVSLGRMKKLYEGLTSKTEEVTKKYKKCIEMLETLEKDESLDLERVNELRIISEKLLEEELAIYGPSDEP